MKKTTAVILFLSFGGVLLFGWIALRITGTLNFYTFATESNMPGHAKGSIFFTSNLKKPDYGNFVCFKNNNTGNEIFIFRVIGKPNDLIEIRDADVYRNGQKLNEPYAWNQYNLSKKDYMGIAGYIAQNKNDVDQPLDTNYLPKGDTSFHYLVSFTNAEVKTYHLKTPKAVTPKGLASSELFQDFSTKKYNTDNLGPIKVPSDSYFLMGDNRHDAMDSRYLGFIKSKDIVSTMLGN